MGLTHAHKRLGDAVCYAHESARVIVVESVAYCVSVRLTPFLIFVRRFERCLEFYQKAFDLKPVRIYRGRGHPRWAELQVGDIRLALHSGYRGQSHRQGRPLAIHFVVKDIRRAFRRIKKYGGVGKGAPRRLDFRPAELKVVYEGRFADPDGNEFEVQQIIKEFG